MTDLKDENIKMLWLSWNFNHSFLSLFQEIITFGNFLFSRTVKKLSHRIEIFVSLQIDKTRRKSGTVSRGEFFLSPSSN